MIKQRLIVQKVCFSFLKIATLLNGAALAVILYFIISRGWRAISWEFLSQAPRDSMTAGGILPCIALLMTPNRRVRWQATSDDENS